MGIKRYLTENIQEELSKKIILLSGPRQVGKTFLSKGLSTSYDYLNYDNFEDRILLLKKQWDRKKSLLILDEVHKMTKWKVWLKGIYDKEGLNPSILVTGSARMDNMKKVGDSLAGRHFQYRMHPFDLKELKNYYDVQEIYKRLMTVSGFPEPFIEAKESFYNKWKKSHLDLILRQDLIDLESVREIASIETLVLLLQERVGSPLSYNSLSRDLHRDPKTIQRWIQILENLFVIFRLQTFHKKIARSVLKEPKIYFYDICRLETDEGIKFENLVALALKKEVDYLTDAVGMDATFNTLRVKGGKEVDFLIQRKGRKSLMIEVKLSEDIPSRQFQIFDKYFPNAHKIQIVRHLSREKTTDTGIEVREALMWLANLNLATLT